MTTANLITGVDLGGDPSQPLLVLGPSLGTSAEALWGRVAEMLTGDFHVVGWDLPGHGHNTAAPTGRFDVADLAAAVVHLASEIIGADETFCYAGDSIGGAVGQQLLLDATDRVESAALVCTAACFGQPQGWHERADLVRRNGTQVMVEGSAKRWFPEGFVDQHPQVAAPLLHALQEADRAGYAAACEALAAFDVRDRLGEIDAPVLVIAGSDDVAAPPQEARSIASTVRDARVVVLDGVGHLAPAEAPRRVADLLREHFARPKPHTTQSEVHRAGMAVRRQVLGDEHVDRAVERTTDFTERFQDMITRYAWGEIWSRPGLDRRSRSMITLTAMIARGHHEEFAMHVRAALRNGLTVDEIEEVILQSAIYCGVPDANTAFRIAQRVLDDGDETKEKQ